MNRCLPLFSPSAALWRWIVLATLFACSCAASANPGVRPFPKNALRGVMQITQPPTMLLNGKAARLSPGARIHTEKNMIVVSGSLIGKNLLVNYVLDPQGMVHEVWILTAIEAQQPMPSGAPKSNYVTDFDTPAKGSAPAASTPASGPH